MVLDAALTAGDEDPTPAVEKVTFRWKGRTLRGNVTFRVDGYPLFSIVCVGLQVSPGFFYSLAPLCRVLTVPPSAKYVNRRCC